jgi:hypothetical protein
MTLIADLYRTFAGSWQVHRVLSSALASMPSATFIGTATLLPFEPSSSAYMYHETGELHTERGDKFPASRKYIYRCSGDELGQSDPAVVGAGASEGEKISVWFVDEHDAQAGLFYELIPWTTENGIWTATGEHTCEPDLYKASYEFTHRDGKLHSWKLRYRVTGPAKQYTSESVYTRVDSA